MVAGRARDRGCVLFALTDHDTCAGVADVAGEGVAVIRAVELSCDHEGRTIHVPMPDVTHQAVIGGMVFVDPEGKRLAA